jgi:hypothetical protein
MLGHVAAHCAHSTVSKPGTPRHYKYQIITDIHVMATTQVCIRKIPGLNLGNSPDILTSADLFYIFLENMLRLNYFNFFRRSEIFSLRALRF